MACTKISSLTEKPLYWGFFMPEYCKTLIVCKSNDANMLNLLFIIMGSELFFKAKNKGENNAASVG